MIKYSTKEVCDLLDISRTTLSELTNGTNRKRNGKIEWSRPSLLSKEDWSIEIVNNRAVRFYTEDAIRKIREFLEKQ